MISKTIEEALNKQINAELYASYLYLAMSADFQLKNFQGLAQWMIAQSKEENGHAMKIYDFVVDRGGKVILSQIQAPPATWASPLAAFKAAYEHEVKVTAMINDLVKLSMAEGDIATQVMLQWFVTEQVEEEAQTDIIVKKLEMIPERSAGIFMLDHELGKRGKS